VNLEYGNGNGGPLRADLVRNRAISVRGAVSLNGWMYQGIIVGYKNNCSKVGERGEGKVFDDSRILVGVSLCTAHCEHRTAVGPDF
jgi:hypothetical protein